MATDAPPPSSALPPLPPDVGQITGPQLIGSLLNFYLFGVLSVQVYVYRLCFPKDKGLIKALVYTIFFFLLLSSCLNAADCWYWFADGFGNILGFMQPHISAFYTPILGSIIAFMIQLFFCYRIWVIKRAALPLSIFIAIISLGQVIGGVGAGLKSYIAANVLHDLARTVLVYMWLVGGAVADVLIAAGMTFLLMQANSKSNGQSNDLVKRIVRLILETNALSASVAIAGLVLFAGVPGTTYFVPMTMVLPGIYANTLMVTLNNRAFVNGAPGNRTQLQQSFVETQHAYPRPPVAPMTFAPNPNRVLVTTHKTTDMDGISLSRLERGQGLEDIKSSGWNDAP